MMQSINLFLAEAAIGLFLVAVCLVILAAIVAICKSILQDLG
jgi:hypothetical protein